MFVVCCQMKDITLEPTFLGKLEQGETFTIKKNGVTVSVVFNESSQTGYVDAGYMEWAYDLAVDTTAEALRLNGCGAGQLGLPQKKDVSKHISGLVVVLVAAKAGVPQQAGP